MGREEGVIEIGEGEGAWGKGIVFSGVGNRKAFPLGDGEKFADAQNFRI